jgi:NADPH:quinone reductase-like Zn-dependent oxidoreductase
VGQHVTRWKKGDRVIIPFIQRWAAGQLTPWQNEIRTGVQIPGALCEYAVQPENTLVRAPENLTDEEAATLPVIGLTAWSNLVSQAKIRAGQVILIQGSGAISLFALQIARVFGLKIIATTGSKENESKLRSLGAEEVINYREKKDWSKEVKRLSRRTLSDHEQHSLAGIYRRPCAGSGRARIRYLRQQSETRHRQHIPD